VKLLSSIFNFVHREDLKKQEKEEATFWMRNLFDIYFLCVFVTLVNRKISRQKHEL
jgi:hypothetical protein